MGIKQCVRGILKLRCCFFGLGHRLAEDREMQLYYGVSQRVFLAFEPYNTNP